jgi:hypothetical protein
MEPAQNPAAGSRACDVEVTEEDHSKWCYNLRMERVAFATYTCVASDAQRSAWASLLQWNNKNEEPKLAETIAAAAKTPDDEANGPDSNVASTFASNLASDVAHADDISLADPQAETVTSSRAFAGTNLERTRFATPPIVILILNPRRPLRPKREGVCFVTLTPELVWFQCIHSLTQIGVLGDGRCPAKAQKVRVSGFF